MKNFKLNKKTVHIGILLSAMFGLATLTFNCAPNAFQGAKYLGSSSSSSSSSTGPSTSADVPYSVMTFLQTYQSMLNVTGQPKQTATQAAEYALRSSALAGDNNLSSVNGPMMIATTSLAGEVCNGLQAMEMAQAMAARKFFVLVDFTKPLSSTSSDQFLQTANLMAAAYYQRGLSADEANILAAYYQSYVSDPAVSQTDVTQTKALYLSLCAAMLSSFDASTF